MPAGVRSRFTGKQRAGNLCRGSDSGGVGGGRNLHLKKAFPRKANRRRSEAQASPKDLDHPRNSKKKTAPEISPGGWKEETNSDRFRDEPAANQSTQTDQSRSHQAQTSGLGNHCRLFRPAGEPRIGAAVGA